MLYWFEISYRIVVQGLRCYQPKKNDATTMAEIDLRDRIKNEPVFALPEASDDAVELATPIKVS